MSEKLKFIPIGEVATDCTRPYDVEMSVRMTIKDFLRWIVENRKDEWGTVYIHIPYNFQDLREKLVTYTKGEIMTVEMILYKLAKNREIKSIRANGGWTLMDYYVELYFDE